MVDHSARVKVEDFASLNILILLRLIAARVIGGTVGFNSHAARFSLTFAQNLAALMLWQALAMRARIKGQHIVSICGRYELTAL